MSEEIVKKVGTQEQVRKLLIDGGEHTIEELMALTGGTKGSVSTAISHLKNEKYAGEAGPIDIAKDTETKKYRLA